MGLAGLQSVWIVNRAGGLSYHHAGPDAPHLSANELLVAASTIQGVHAISSRISPAGDVSSGAQYIEWHGPRPFALYCIQTETGMKTIATCSLDVSRRDAELVLRKLAVLYTDYALKNPFYTLEMPIRCELFELHVRKLFIEN
jgi:hypothetical protein